jgi:enoyl-CoA hydratase/carnithine racemase
MSSRPSIRLDLAEGGALARLEIHLPPVNVIGAAHLAEITRRVEEATGSRVLLLSAMRGVLAALLESPTVTIAAVSGACLGGGAEIAAACDFVLAAEDARIGFPEIRLGCFPPAAAALLPPRIGEARAAEWILTGKSYSGIEAVSAGFATRAVPAARLEGEALRLAAELLSRDPMALSEACRLLRRPRQEALAHALPLAEDAYRKLQGSEALMKAIQDFKSK